MKAAHWGLVCSVLSLLLCGGVMLAIAGRGTERQRAAATERSPDPSVSPSLRPSIPPSLRPSVSASPAAKSAYDARLLERIARLEAELAGLQSRVAGLEDSGDREIRARGFAVVDRHGQVWARLGFDRVGSLEHVHGLYVYDQNGTKRAIVVENGWGAGLGIYRGDGSAHLSLTSTSRPERLTSPREPAPYGWVADRDGPAN